MSDLTQGSLFDYSGYSEIQIQKSIENKAAMLSIGKMVSEGLIEIAKYAKSQHDNLGKYSAYIDWCQKELNYSPPVAKRFLRVGKSLGSNPTPKMLPDSLSGLDAIASALLKADSEETKEEILDAVREETESKGKPLTEKEIKSVTNRYLELKTKLKDPNFQYEYSDEDLATQFELPIEMITEAIESVKAETSYSTLKLSMEMTNDELQRVRKQLEDTGANDDSRKKLKEKVNQLENMKACFEQKIKELEREKTDQQTTIDKQKETIKEAKTKISELEQSLSEIDIETADLTKKADELAVKIAKEKTEKEVIILTKKQEELNKQLKKLKEKEKDINKLLLQQKYLQTALNETKKWVDDIRSFNNYLNAITPELDLIVLRMGEAGNPEKFPVVQEEIDQFCTNIEAIERIIKLFKDKVREAQISLNKAVDVEAKEVNVKAIVIEEEPDPIPF